jgi:hypothetical protein
MSDEQTYECPACGEEMTGSAEIVGLRLRVQELEAEMKQMADAIETDKQFFRREFIRRAFIAYVARGLEIDTAWERAKAAWELKPENC